MQLALTAPERVERLVLACTAARFGDPAQWLDRAALVRAEGLESIVDAVLARWFTPQFTGVGAYRDMLLSIDPEGYARCCDALARWDVRGALSPVRAPTLVIAGADDPSTPPDTLEAIAAGDPGGALRGDRRRRPHRKRGAGRCVQPTDRGASVSNEDGMKVRREVLGDDHVDRAVERHDRVHRRVPGPDHALRLGRDLVAAGPRPAHAAAPSRSRRWSRSAIDEELAMHVRAALANGLTPDEIKEVLLQAAIYCGVPAANRAFAIAQQRARRVVRRLRTQVGDRRRRPGRASCSRAARSAPASTSVVLEHRSRDYVEAAHPRRRARAGNGRRCSRRAGVGERLRSRGHRRTAASSCSSTASGTTSRCAS